MIMANDGEPDAFEPKSWVRHVAFGRGRVLACSGQKVVVSFERGERKTVLAEYLQPVAGGEIVRLASRSVQRKKSSSTVEIEPYELHYFADIDPNVVKEWTVEDWFGLGELLVPYGAPGSGKSVLIGDLACHIGAGWRWFGKATKQAAVLYVAAERAKLVERRFAAFRRRHEIDDLPVAVIKGYFDMASAPRDTDRIILTIGRLLEQTKLAHAVVIIDTKRQVIRDENSDDIGALVGNLARIQQETQAGIVVIDHSPFHSPTKMSGRGELLGATDSTILIEKQDDAIRTAKVMKANDGPDDLALAFTLESVELGTDAAGKVTTAPVVVPADMPEPGSRSKGYLTPSEKIAFAAIEEAVLAAGERSPGSHIPAAVLTVTVELWREYAYKRGISDTDNPQARKKAFQRARQSLIAKGRVATWGDQVWPVTVSDQLASAVLNGSGGHGT